MIPISHCVEKYMKGRFSFIYEHGFDTKNNILSMPYIVYDREGHVPIMTIVKSNLNRREAEDWCRVLNQEDQHYLAEVYWYVAGI